MTALGLAPLRAHDGGIAAEGGAQVILRGVCLGGWMSMENALAGFPATETLAREVLRASLGEEGYARFFDRFLDVFFGAADAALLASLGLNCVRLGFSYRHFEDDQRPFEFRNDGFELLDRAVQRCADNGLYAVLDLHAAPGFQNRGWHADNPTHHAWFWEYRHFQDRVVAFWEAAAARYAGNAAVAGYNILNEPADPQRTRLVPFYERVLEAVRAVDSEHIVFLDGARGAEFDMFDRGWPNTVWSVHDYSIAGFAGAGPYPGYTGEDYVDRASLERTFLDRTTFMRERGLPIWVGEFGPSYTGDDGHDAMCRQLLVDQLEIFNRHRVGWSLWTYKDVGVQGVVCADPDSAYVARIAQVLEKKSRLGVDEWGTTDSGIRASIAPLEDLIEREFPRPNIPTRDRMWKIHRLVRHILLAEEMLDEFGQCFAGLSPDEAEGLAESFRLDACIRRTELLSILRDAASKAAAGGRPCSGPLHT